MNIDEWAAEQRGIEWIAVREGWFWYPINHAITEDTEAVKWTLQDARCREIVREHFNICTTAHRLEAGSDDIRWFSRTVEYDFCVSSKTIAEAEIACITAIWEVS